jgi:PsbP
MLSAQKRCAVGVAILALAASGCGSSASSSTSPAASTSATASAGTGSSGASASSPAALSAEAHAAATGDIPDNQMFLVFTDTAAGYSIKYPEGWTRRGSGVDVTFQSNNNVVHVVVSRGSAPTAASVAAQLESLRRSNQTLAFRSPAVVPVGSSQAVKATYTTESAPSPVTGKRVRLTVDRYELAHGGRRTVIDLGTQVGVDNVDAYRMMIRSFRWR